ncbi:MAG: nucleotide sugar dehydrogenase [Rhodospirillaceae bacterium]|jgi:UDP-N-acetyl-D-glucosamine dehydrogenase|nr:nucleotide sugar dehydrogenase [Rhodospirillaceae bacterium]MBT5563540.1 nucleotide sugar dehydrogenase [Rhodospirillaceae bacterium]MBT7137735.1 nucleotide sugar dehydrogenase [Rhodospirillaceae bacterium]
MTAVDSNSLRSQFDDLTARIGIIGMGYVGLPLALACVKSGFATTGFDVDEEKVEALLNGRSYLKHIDAAHIKEAAQGGKLDATDDFSRLADMDAIIICVPTPLAAGNVPDLSYVTSTTDVIAKYLRAGQMVVLESTTYPGTTAEVMRPILEAGGLKSGQDFFLAYSPEREDPGNPTHETSIIPKVVGGDGEEALKLAVALYDKIVVQTVPVSSLDTAEAVKLTENIFRSVNIALVNELKLIYGKMGIDIWEVIEAAKSKPFGYMPFYPGPGLGGHCIPIDPFYLTWRAKQFGQQTRFIELAGEINTAMPNHVVEVLEGALKERFDKSLKGSKILILGIAYKKNVADVRESPAFAIIELLEGNGATTAFYDPHVLEIPTTREHMDLAGRKSIEWNPDTFGEYDATLIATDHDGVDYEVLTEKSLLVIDSRNATRDNNDQDGKIVRD